MQKNPEIILPYGTQFVSTGEIPALIAAALHPEPRDDPQNITGIQKNSRGKTPQEIDIRDDQSELDKIWQCLPKLAFPISEKAWQPYEAAFNLNGRHLGWELIPLYSSPSVVANIKRRHTQREHLPLLRTAIKDGKLRPLDPVSHVPKTLCRDDGIVPVAALTTYVAQFSIGVRVEAAAPAESPPVSVVPSFPQVASSSNSKPGLDRPHILRHQWPLSGDFTANSFDAALSDVPDWLKVARMTPGTKGKHGSATWNPVLIAVALHGKNYARLNALDQFFSSHLSDWLDEWNRCRESL